MYKVDVLFARKDSIYKTFPECDVWDAERDVRNYKPTGRPVICHPPCRAWGVLRHFATNADPIEAMWPWWCKDLVDQYGGVIEHPATSLFFKKVKGYFVDQWWWGHPYRKRTGLYLNGYIPPVPFKLGKPAESYQDLGQTDRQYKREHTPPDFAKWLIEAVL